VRRQLRPDLIDPHKVAVRSPSRLHPRIALTRPGDARVKAGGAVPLAEPELSPASRRIPQPAVEGEPMILGEPVRSITPDRLSSSALSQLPEHSLPLVVKNERSGDVLESLERTGQVGRTFPGWHRLS
jgi:hypothetical protein